LQAKVNEREGGREQSSAATGQMTAKKRVPDEWGVEGATRWLDPSGNVSPIRSII